MRNFKNLYCLIFAGCLTLGFASMAMAHQAITVDVVGLVDDGAYVVRYEPHMGYFVAGGGIINSKVGDTDINGYQMMFGGRKYINEHLKYIPPDDCSGFFVEGDITASFVHMEQYGYEKDQTITGLTGIFGYKWVAQKRSGFTAEFGIGPRFTLADSFGDYEAEKTEAVIVLNLGYTW